MFFLKALGYGMKIRATPTAGKRLWFSSLPFTGMTAFHIGKVFAALSLHPS